MVEIKHHPLQATGKADLQTSVETSKVLVVGAGGIGCELLKNLVLSGFRDIVIIDLDTIDVSNLNRQFLFQRKHVSQSKARVARESALAFEPDAKIEALHASVISPEYGVNFVKQFNLVMNALDNQAARNHMNRLCLAAEVPLIESGTAGYKGQVSVIKKATYECYECHPPPPQKSYPGCTIRNTPSEPIHCIVWAKHLFNQLFGEEDPDQDVSPDTDDPELGGTAGQRALDSSSADGEGGSAGEGSKPAAARKSTKAWAREIGYDVKKLFMKFFNSDVHYLLSMDKLWERRRRPTPLDCDDLPEEPCCSNTSTGGLEDLKMWSLKECFVFFHNAVDSLKARVAAEGGDGVIVWDKDDDPSMDFVTACANIRAAVFGIKRKSRFDVKSMAGNIVPAIATTNAVIAGAIVMEAFKILAGNLSECKRSILFQHPTPLKKLLIASQLAKPNPNCAVCSPKPQVFLKINAKTFTVKNLEEKVLKGALNMIAPDVQLDDNTATILLSSEEGETESNNDKTLEHFGIRDGTRLLCDDFLQNYSLAVVIMQTEEAFASGEEFMVMGKDALDQFEKERKEAEEKAESSKLEEAAPEPAVVHKPTGDKEGDAIEVDDDDPVFDGAVMYGMEDEDLTTFGEEMNPGGPTDRKRKMAGETGGGDAENGAEEPSSKKRKPGVEEHELVEIDEPELVTLN